MSHDSRTLSLSSLIPTAANGNLRTSSRIRRHGQTRRRRRRRRRLLPLQAQLLLEFTHHPSQSSFIITRLSCCFLGTTTTGELFFHFRRGLIYFILDHLRGFLHRRGNYSGVLGLLLLLLLFRHVRKMCARARKVELYIFISDVIFFIYERNEKTLLWLLGKNPKKKHHFKRHFASTRDIHTYILLITRR